PSTPVDLRFVGSTWHPPPVAICPLEATAGYGPDRGGSKGRPGNSRRSRGVWKHHPPVPEEAPHGMMLLSALLQIEPPGGLTETLAGRPLLALAALFGAGVLTSLTPWVYPMFRIAVSVIGGTAREGQRRGRTVAL